MTEQERQAIQEMISAAIVAERDRIASAISCISMEYTGGYYDQPSSPDFNRFIDDITKAVSGK